MNNMKNIAEKHKGLFKAIPHLLLKNNILIKV